MTLTATPTGCITERTWTVPATKRRAERTATYLAGHLSADCPQAKGPDVRMVEQGLPFDAVLSAWPCSACIPVDMLPGARGVFEVDAAEVAAQDEVDRRRAEWARMTSGEGNGSGGHRAAVVDGPTAKQEQYLRSLWADLARLNGDADPAATVEARVAKARETRGVWTAANVSSLIDDAKADLHVARNGMPRADAPAGVEILDRANRYGGHCVLCGGYVADNAGRLAKQAGKWAVAHRDGECGEQAAPVETSAPVAVPDVPAGHYAIPSRGDNDLMFVRIDRPTDGAYAGRVFAKMIVGGHPDQNVRRDAVPGILARIVEYGVAESARLYGQELGRCARCNRTLTDEESRRFGMGPECRAR